ncbi:MAG TPA: transcription antitermination factor NusB [Rickettsiales bacterium]|nr:transcription antitermination factor NusB [Rickettsiales bacterium]
MNDNKPKPPPLSLRKKSSARLAAVQCVYRLELNRERITPQELFDDYMAQWHEDKDSTNRAMSFEAEPDKPLFLRIISGVIEKSDEIGQFIRSSLNDKWKLERMSPLLIAIIACAVYEIRHLSSKPVIAVNEYVTLTGRFFDLPEVGFVNGILDKLAKEQKTT